jgi:hypothetical protein
LARLAGFFAFRQRRRREQRLIREFRHHLIEEQTPRLELDAAALPRLLLPPLRP